MENLTQGVELSLIGITIVFSGLVIIAIVLSLTSKLINQKYSFGKKNLLNKKEEVSVEVSVAISSALYIYRMIYEERNKELILKQKSATPFSPWRS